MDSGPTPSVRSKKIPGTDLTIQSPAGSFISPLSLVSPPTLVRCTTDSPSHYFLRGNHRWSSTPLLKVPGLGRSCSIPISYTQLVSGQPIQTSTPDTAAGNGRKDISTGSCSELSISSLSASKISSDLSQVSSLSALGPKEFQKRIDNLDQTETEDAAASREADSGIGSSLQSSYDTSSNLSKVHYEPVIPKLRRSPRQLVTNRLDRCTRLVSDKVKTKLRPPDDEHRSVHPAGLFVGKETIDFLARLAERDMWQITDKIFSFLSDVDLCSVSMVNSTWRKALESRMLQDQRRRIFVQEKKLNRENLGEVILRTRTSPRLAMQEVNRNLSPINKRNRLDSKSSSIAVSPKKVRNRLFPDTLDLSVDRLLHCPNCSASSLVDQATGTAECSSTPCGLVFCSQCFYSQHTGKPCRVLQTGVRSKSAVVVSSKRSKHRLRRL